ncbi:MAG: hypothetical protein L0154_19370 [Chloroflexi bacterium]|nr:hypothetical protein [Chloroflexota bacterium]
MTLKKIRFFALACIALFGISGTAQSIQNKPAYHVVFTLAPRDQELLHYGYAQDFGILNPETGGVVVLEVGFISSPNLFQVAPDGRIVYWNAEFDTTEVVDPRSGESVWLESMIDKAHFDLATGGDTVVFEGSDYASLYLTDLRGESAALIVDDIYVYGPFLVSPDGERVAFRGEAINNPGQVGLFIVNTDGTDLSRFNSNPDEFLHRWQPNGEAVVMARNRSLYLIDVETGKEIFLVADGSGVRFMNDEVMVYRSLRGNEEAVYTINVTNLERRILFTGPRSWGLFPSPDGKQIVYSLTREDDPWLATICIYDIQDDSTQCFDDLNMTVYGIAHWLPVN